MGKKTNISVNDNDDYSIGVDWEKSGDVEKSSITDLCDEEDRTVRHATRSSGISQIWTSLNDFVSIPRLSNKTSNMIVIPTYPTSVGTEKFRADYRQICSLLLVSSVSMTFSWLPELSRAGLPSTTLDWVLLLAGVCQVLIGVIGSIVGALGCFYDAGHLGSTIAFIGITQLAWLPFAAQLTQLAKGLVASPKDNPFIPFDTYEPSQTDVVVVGVLAMISAVVYSVSTVGPVMFSALTILNYQRGDCHLRSAPFFRTRAYFYNAVVIAGGSSLLIAGVYLHKRFGTLWNPANPETVSAGSYLITSPQATMGAGLLQLIYGLLGMCRTARRTLMRGEWNGGNSSTMSIMLPILAFWTWAVLLSIQVVMPFRMSSANNWEGSTVPAASPASLASAMVGCIYMTLFLDAKLKVLPEKLDKDYYGDLDFLQAYEESDSQGIRTEIGNSGSFSH